MNLECSMTVGEFKKNVKCSEQMAKQSKQIEVNRQFC